MHRASWFCAAAYLRAAWRGLRSEKGEGPASYLGTMIIVFAALMGIAAVLGKEGFDWSKAAQAVADKIGDAISHLKFKDN